MVHCGPVPWTPEAPEICPSLCHMAPDSCGDRALLSALLASAILGCLDLAAVTHFLVCCPCHLRPGEPVIQAQWDCVQTNKWNLSEDTGSFLGMACASFGSWSWCHKNDARGWEGGGIIWSGGRPQGTSWGLLEAPTSG